MVHKLFIRVCAHFLEHVHIPRACVLLLEHTHVILNSIFLGGIDKVYADLVGSDLGLG
jgi:hypothetical protein